MSNIRTRIAEAAAEVSSNARHNHKRRREMIREVRAEMGEMSGWYKEAERRLSTILLPEEAYVDRVTISASIAGNSKVDHARVTYKIDGKRASKAKLEEFLSAE